jgi:hypothetical protein
MEKKILTKNSALIIGAYINIILFLGHLICLISLETIFKFYGIADLMNKFAETYGNSFPYIITIIISLCFLACALYALSACGIIFKLPFIREVIFVIVIIFILRALWGISIMLNHFTYLELSSTLASMIIGLLYLFGGIKALKEKTKNTRI